jgi:photosystem II stability/assembly factor-like uncharacterized protein
MRVRLVLVVLVACVLAAVLPVVASATVYTYDLTSTSTTSPVDLAFTTAGTDPTPAGSAGAADNASRRSSATEDGGVDLGSATTVSGKFPASAEPGEVMVRRDPVTGGPTSYQEYGPDGLPTKRVDLPASAKQ